MSQTMVQVQKDVVDLSLFQNTPRIVATNHLLMVNLVRDVVLAQAFPVLTSNFSNSTVRLRKSQVVDYAIPSPEAIFALEEGEVFQEPSLRDSNVADWINEVHIGVQCRKDLQMGMELLKEFQKMRSG